MRQTKAVANEAHGSSTQQYNQAQEAHLICHVRTEEELEEAAPCQHSLTRIFHSKNQLQKKKEGIAVSSAGALLYSQGLPGRLSHAKPRPMPTRGEVSGSRRPRGANGSGSARPAALTPPRQGRPRPDTATAARHPATAGNAGLKNKEMHLLR